MKKSLHKFGLLIAGLVLSGNLTAQCTATGDSLVNALGVTFPTDQPTFNGSSMVFGTGTADQILMLLPMLQSGIANANDDVNLNIRLYMTRISSDNDPIMGFTDGNGTDLAGFLANDGNSHFKVNGTITGNTFSLTYTNLVNCNGSCGTSINDSYIVDMTFDITAGAVSTIDSTFQGVNSQGTTSTYTETFDPSTGITFFLGRQSSGESYQIDSVEYQCSYAAPSVTGISQSASALCAGDSVNFSVQATGMGATYQWQLNGVDIAGADSSVYELNPASAADAGSYQCVVSNQIGADSSSVVQLTVSNPTAQIIGASNICMGDSTTLTAQASGGVPNYTYTWTPGGTAQSATVSPTTDTWYYMSVVDSLGCTSPQDSLQLIVNPIPQVTMTALDTTCVNFQAFQLTAGTPAGGTYSGTGVSNGMFDPNAAGVGTHTITYTYTDSVGCSASTSNDIEVSGCASLTSQELTEVQVFPNPMSNELTLVAQDEFQFEILDINGRLIFAGEGSESVVVNTENYEAGVYSVRIQVGSHTSSVRVIKQ